MVQSKLIIVPCDLDEAKFFVKQHHRHHEPPQGAKFAIAVADETETIRGVAIVGRPVCKALDNGWTLEVTRTATDGCDNACSALYGASWRATKSLGYRKCITYTGKDESGISLVAAGWKIVGETKGGSWSCKSRPRIDKHPLQEKFRWEASGSADVVTRRDKLEVEILTDRTSGEFWADGVDESL